VDVSDAYDKQQEMLDNRWGLADIDFPKWFRMCINQLEKDPNSKKIALDQEPARYDEMLKNAEH
jgi:hypothetical protein